MKLVNPSLHYQEQYLQALEEGKTESTTTMLNAPAEGQSFAAFVQVLIDNAKGLQLPEGYVPQSNYWLIDNDTFIGSVSIRHKLTEFLLKEGGSIGYYIRPSKRNLGYGRKILELALLEAKKLGLTKVLITCDDTNIGSQKIIEANGGVLENIIELKEGHPKKMRYWISLSN